MYGIAGLLTGRTLGGRYLVEAVIGRGGMGAVYRAVDERLSRPVAVKVVGASTNDPDEAEHLRARFHREARAAAALRHPNVVQVHDFGTDAELDLDFLVMELLHGEDLAARLMRGGPPPLSASISILRQAARGLSAGHRAGMVHRDVKPGNLFLEDEDDGRMHVRVLDFGIAQIAAGEGDTMTHLTVYGRSPFSPAYASPEQLRGDDRITAASDVFSLAAVGYHLVTGTRPFTSSDANRAAAEVRDAVRLLRDRSPELDDATYAVLVRALARTPAERFPDAGAMADALAGTEPARPRARHAPAPSPAPPSHAPTYARSTPSAPPRAFAADDTRMHAPTPRPRMAPQQVAVPSVFTPAPRPHPAPAQHAPDPHLGHASVQPHDAAGGETHDPRRQAAERSAFRRFVRLMWELTLTSIALGMFVGAWWLAIAGALEPRRAWLWAGTAATIFCTPLALHRLTSRKGRLTFGVIGSIGATLLGWRLTGRAGLDHAVSLAAIFGLQVIASLLMSWLTRRREQHPDATA